MRLGRFANHRYLRLPDLIPAVLNLPLYLVIMMLDGFLHLAHHGGVPLQKAVQVLVREILVVWGCWLHIVLLIRVII